jgi:hypothetical protein
VQACPQQTIVVVAERALRPYERFEVTGLEMLDKGLKLDTPKGQKKARWEDVRLVSCGRLDREVTVDLFAGLPLKHYRLRASHFNFRAMAPEAESTLDASKALLTELRGHCRKAIRSHTMENFLSGKMPKPQKFASEGEFDKYNMWMVMAHFAEVVNAVELVEQARVSSDW